LCAKRLEVIVHDLVQRASRRTPGFVGRRERGHATLESGRRASEEREEIGLKASGPVRQVADFAVLLG
jgi:hypothetical protein